MIVLGRQRKHGVSAAGLKFRIGTHGLHEELGRHRGREECDESVSHVSWDFPGCSRNGFMLELRKEL